MHNRARLIFILNNFPVPVAVLPARLAVAVRRVLQRRMYLLGPLPSIYCWSGPEHWPQGSGLAKSNFSMPSIWPTAPQNLLDWSNVTATILCRPRLPLPSWIFPGGPHEQAHGRGITP